MSALVEQDKSSTACPAPNHLAASHPACMDINNILVCGKHNLHACCGYLCPIVVETSAPSSPQHCPAAGFEHKLLICRVEDIDCV